MKRRFEIRHNFIVLGGMERSMRRRHGYVSNSSSSSFVILNWSELDNWKRGMVLNYGEHALEVWKQNGLSIRKECNGFCVDFDALPKGDIFREHGNGETDRHMDMLDFGLVDSCWRFREKDGRLEMITDMDNFDMGKWMDYVGGIDYKWTGERFGLFDDEKMSSIL